MRLAKDIWPGIHSQHSPTLTHSFLALLAQKMLLVRCYTQNIDGLEYLAQVPSTRLFECHGHFRSATCVYCKYPADIERIKAHVMMSADIQNDNDSLEEENDNLPPICNECGKGYIKPDIVFFGEALPYEFPFLLEEDLPETDLLLILGTSLQVVPVSTIPDCVDRHCRRVLLNKDLVGNLDLNNPQRDLFHEGDCDDSIRSICRVLGWEEELLQQNEKTKL